MKKGQVRKGTVESVVFPDKGWVRLDPEDASAAAGAGVGSGAEAGAGFMVETGGGSGAEGSLPADTSLVRPEYCTVSGALPQQRVELVVTKIRSGKGQGRLLKVLSPAPGEHFSEEAGCCRHFGACGGCVSISLPYREALSIKERQVRELLKSVLTCPVEPILASPVQTEYRNKMEFTFGDEEKGGPLSLGMHRRGSCYDVVTTEGCRLVDGDFRGILTATRTYFQKTGLPYYHRLTKQGYLRHLLVRKASHTGEILVALVTTSQREADLKEWVAKLLSLPLTGRLTGILHVCNDSAADAVKCDRMELLFGRDFIEEDLLGLRFRISPFSFFQTNSAGAEVLYSLVREWVSEAMRDTPGRGEGDRREKGTEAAEMPALSADSGPVIYDLYSGTGTIAQLLAPAARKVIGVEIVEEAVEAARESSARNGLTNCTFIAGDVLDTLDRIGEKPDFIVLDPPRDGVHPRALQKILSYGAPNLIYISCKPTSLARDLETMLAQGYQAVRCVPLDMFPWTGNVETVCLLSRQNTTPNGFENPVHRDRTAYEEIASGGTGRDCSQRDC